MSSTSVKRALTQIVQGGTSAKPVVIDKAAFEQVAAIAKRTSGVDAKERELINTFVQGAEKPSATYKFDQSGTLAAAAFMKAYALDKAGEVDDAKSLPEQLVMSVGEYAEQQAAAGGDDFPQASEGYYDGITVQLQAGPDADVLAGWLKDAARNRVQAEPGSRVWNIIPDDFDSKKQALLVATFGYDEQQIHVSIVDIETGKITKGVSVTTVDLRENDDLDPDEQIEKMLKTAVIATHIESKD